MHAVKRIGPTSAETDGVAKLLILLNKRQLTRILPRKMAVDYPQRSFEIRL